MTKDFAGAFKALREILKKHSRGMIVVHDTPAQFMAITRALAPNGKPFSFATILMNKSAVSYHLFPLYFNPVLQAAVPESLRRRMQGKTCFSFQRPEPELFEQLGELTRQGREGYERHGFLEPGKVESQKLAEALQAAGENPEALAALRKKKGREAARKRRETIIRKKQSAAKERKS